MYLLAQALYSLLLTEGFRPQQEVVGGLLLFCVLLFACVGAYICTFVNWYLRPGLSQNKYLKVKLERWEDVTKIMPCRFHVKLEKLSFKFCCEFHFTFSKTRCGCVAFILSLIHI